MTSARSWLVRDSRRRWLVTAGAIAVLLHLPFTPLPFIIRLLAHFLQPAAPRWDYQDDSVIIPITLFEDDTSSSAAPSVQPATGGLDPSGSPVPSDPGRDAGITDAGPEDAAADAADDALLAGREAGARRRRRDAQAESPTPLVASEDAATSTGSDRGGPRVKDTIALVGGLGKLVTGKANVSIVLWFATMREHPLGHLVSSMLSCNPQWREFLGDQIDPLRDLDGVMLFGPRMADSSKVTVLAQSRMTDVKVREVMAFLADRGGGGWVDAGAGQSAVRFQADRAPRVAFTHPRNMIIVTPPEGFEQLSRHKEPLALPKGRGQALSLTLVTPARPLRAVGARLPESLTEMRVAVLAAADGGLDVQVEFDDADAAQAEVHAREVTDQARSAFSPLLSDLEFVAKDNHLSASTHLSRLLSSLALGFARNAVCPAPRREQPLGPPDAGASPRPSSVRNTSAARGSTPARHTTGPRRGTSSRRERPRRPGKRLDKAKSRTSPTSTIKRPVPSIDGDAARSPSTASPTPT